MSVSLSSTTPSAPPGYILATPQADGLGHISIAIPSSSGGGFEYTVTSQTSNYAASSGDDVWCSGTFTVTLPVLTTSQRVKVNNRGTGQITVVPTSGNINGGVSLILARRYSSCEFSGDGTNIGVE